MQVSDTLGHIKGINLTVSTVNSRADFGKSEHTATDIDNREWGTLWIL